VSTEQYVLSLVALSVIPVIAFVIGGRMARTPPDLRRYERRELEARRDFMGRLGPLADEHAKVWGDPFAALVQNMMAEERQKGLQ
jgi:hypothetical protein